jgi:hypothetical protein
VATSKKTPAAPSDASLDDLLSITADDSVGAELTTDETPVETDIPLNADAPDALSFEDVLAESEEDQEDAEIKRLKAELAKPMPKPEVAELTPKQQELKALKDQLAQRRAQELSFLPPTYEDFEEGEDAITIHILIDGFTVQGEVFYRGQEIVFPKGGKAYQQTINRLGKSWLDLRSDDNAQYDRWGKVYFHEGPWPFKGWEQLTLRDLGPDATEADLAKAIKSERLRRRLAPVLPGD